MKRNVLLIILCLIFSNGAIATDTLSKLPFLQSMKGLSWDAAFEQVLKIKGCELYAGQLQSIKDQKESKGQNEEVLAFRCFDKALVNTPVKVAVGFKLSKVNSIAIFAALPLV